MKEFSFKKFEDRRTRVETRITITKSGSIGLPTGFYKLQNIAKEKFATLFYDQKNKAIGIQFTGSTKEKGSFPLLHNNRGYGASILVKSFLKLSDINTELYHGRYEWKQQFVSGIGNMYIIELKERKNEE